MDRTHIHEAIRRMRFENVLRRTERSELSQMKAAELLGVSEWTFRLWWDRHREHGAEGLLDHRLRPSLRCAPVVETHRRLRASQWLLPRPCRTPHCHRRSSARILDRLMSLLIATPHSFMIAAIRSGSSAAS